jgi:hypothetical protein
MTMPMDRAVRATHPVADLVAGAGAGGMVALAVGAFPWWPNYSTRPLESIVHSILDLGRRTARPWQRW